MRRELSYFVLVSECNKQAVGSKGGCALALKPAYGLLLAMGLFALALARPGEPEFTLEQPDHYFGQVMTQLQRGLKSANSSCISLSEKIDRLASALAQEVQRDPKLVQSIRSELRTDQLEEDALGGQSRHKRSPFGFSTQPSGGFLDALSSPNVGEPQGRGNGRIVHKKRRLNMKRFRRQVCEQFTRLPRYDQDQWIRTLERLEKDTQLASKRGLDNEYNLKEDKSRIGAASRIATIRRLIEIAANTGLRLFDHFYATPDFLYDIPMIGDQLRMMRRKGEPIFHLVNVLRHTVSLYKIRNGQQVIGRDGRVQSEKRTKQLLKESGVIALKSIFEQVFKQRLSTKGELATSKVEREFDTRLFYGIASFAMENKDTCGAPDPDEESV